MPYYDMDKSRGGGRRQRKNYDDAPKWLPCVPRTSQKYPLVDMDICFCFFAPSMATVMDSI